MNVMAHSSADSLNDIHEPFAGEVSMEYERLGCLPLGTDNSFVIDSRDLKCMHDGIADAKSPCRGGLPFFSQKVDKTSAVEACFRFCASKALDLFGLSPLQSITAEHTECRCGASDPNQAIWGPYLDSSLARGLHMNMSAVQRTSEDAPCTGAQVFRYIGWLEREQAEGIPWVLIQASPEDIAYVDSIVQGKQIPVVTSTASKVEQKGSLWPHSSAGKGGVIVSYSFAENFDPLAKRMFWRAATEWNYRSIGCIRFDESPTNAKLTVDLSDAAKCGPDSKGYHGPNGGVLQLGGCHDQRKLDRIVHALAGVLGFDVPYGGQGALSPEHTNGILKAYDCPVHRMSALL